MVSIRRNVIKGHSYYYLVETARVNGKSKTVWQKYLGTARKIKADYLNKDGDITIHSKTFGSVASMLSIAEELGFESIINKIILNNNYKLSIYQHILMQSICRFNVPNSKTKSIDWYNESLLSLLWKKKFLSVQTILNQFDKIIDKEYKHKNAIEEELCKALLSKGIKPSTLIWDPTNFFTYIVKGENLPKKGSSKEKRFDKNLINLGLIVSGENIPLMHEVYEGNKKESNVITKIVDLLHSRLVSLGVEVDKIVFVFDKGNNSKENIPMINDKFHFIGSLRRSQLKHLFEIPLNKFSEAYTTKKGTSIKAYETKEMIYGKEYRIVLAYNPSSYTMQKKKADFDIEKIKKNFSSLEEKFKNKTKGKKTKVKGISQEISKFLYKQYSALFSWDFNAKEQKFSWAFNQKEAQEREKTYGKMLLFTDLENKTAKEIIETYNSKSVIESDFKSFKDKLIIPIKPIYMRKDSRLKAHIFVCVLSMVFYKYLLWKLKDLKMSEKEILEELRSMRLSFVKQGNSNTVKPVLEKMTPKQIEIYNALKLGNFMPN